MTTKDGGLMERVLYSIGDAVEQLGIGRTMAYALMKRGDLTAVKIGRRTLITAESLAAYVERLASVESGGDGSGVT